MASDTLKLKRGETKQFDISLETAAGAADDITGYGGLAVTIGTDVAQEPALRLVAGTDPEVSVQVKPAVVTLVLTPTQSLALPIGNYKVNVWVKRTIGGVEGWNSLETLLAMKVENGFLPEAPAP